MFPSQTVEYFTRVVDCLHKIKGVKRFPLAPFLANSLIHMCIQHAHAMIKFLNGLPALVNRIALIERLNSGRLN